MPGLTPRIAALANDQELVQATKSRTRIASGYDSYDYFIFPAGAPDGTEVTRFLQKRVPGASSLESLLQGMHRQREQAELHWADMGGGYGGAQRELQHRGTTAFVVHTCVDILPPYDNDVSDFTRREHARTVPGFDVLDPRNAPTYLQDDITSVRLPRPADVITAVQSLMYVHDPLRALTNWYNQLAPGGLAVVTTEQRWAEIIYRHRSLDMITLSEVDECLQEAGIPHAFAERSGGNRLEYVNTFAMQKVAGTELRSCVALHTGVTEDGFVEVQYPDMPLAVLSAH